VPDAYSLRAEFDGGSIQPIALEDTSHYQITKGILQKPGGVLAASSANTLDRE
jgi:hypothetical protein